MQKKGNILIADDDKTILKSLKILLEKDFGNVTTISNPNLILNEYQKNNYDIVLLDMNFAAGINSGNEGIYWLNEILKYDKNAVIILITAYGDIELAVKALKEGATDFISKPWNNEKLISTLQAALKIRFSQVEIEKLTKEKSELNAEFNRSDEIIGSSIAIKSVLEIISKVAKTDANVLIQGENGTGKELLAKRLHKQSNRANNPFISIDLGSISENLFESELFGYVKGAFTDATSDKTGRIEIANGGTLFLDEISNIPLSSQAKLLTFIQNKEIIALGSTKSKKIDIRLVCATNQNIEKLIVQGKFREDLYYRINTITVESPALRNRESDCLLIANHYLNLFKLKYNKPDLTLGTSANEAIEQYLWPGNIRELKHTIEKASILCDSRIIEPSDLMISSTSEQKKTTDWPLKFEDIEKQAIQRALDNNNGIIVDAAKELGLTRQTLHNKIKKYKL